MLHFSQIQPSRDREGAVAGRVRGPVEACCQLALRKVELLPDASCTSVYSTHMPIRKYFCSSVRQFRQKLTFVIRIHYPFWGCVAP